MRDDLTLTHDPDYFRAMYSAHTDPWGFDERWYERRKYAITMASLDRLRYRCGLEVGCANGSLTELLAARCDQLVAFDLMQDPVARAQTRLRSQPHVRVLQEEFPQFWPAGGGDLVVWSEVAYYLTDRGVQSAIRGLDQWLWPDGALVAVHYTGDTDYPRHGSSIAPMIDETPFLERVTTHLDSQFELGVWVRA